MEDSGSGNVCSRKNRQHARRPGRGRESWGGSGKRLDARGTDWENWGEVEKWLEGMEQTGRTGDCWERDWKARAKQEEQGRVRKECGRHGTSRKSWGRSEKKLEGRGTSNKC